MFRLDWGYRISGATLRGRRLSSLHLYLTNLGSILHPSVFQQSDSQYQLVLFAKIPLTLQLLGSFWFQDNRDKDLHLPRILTCILLPMASAYLPISFSPFLEVRIVLLVVSFE